MELTEFIILIGAVIAGLIMTRNGFLCDLVGKLQVSWLAKDFWDVAYLLLAIVICAIPSKIAWILGVLIFGYMYIQWKGFSFSGNMYATKRDLDNAVSSIREKVNQLSASISDFNRSVTNGIMKLYENLGELFEILNSIIDEVNGVQVEVDGMISETRSIEERLLNMNERMDLMGENQDLMNSALMFLIESRYF